MFRFRFFHTPEAEQPEPQHPELKRHVECTRFFAKPSRLGVVSAACVLIGVVAGALPTSYVVEGPGPAINVNAKVNGANVLTVSEHPTYSSDSQLFFTTVTSWGNADSGVPASQALAALLDPHKQLYPVRALYPPSATADEVNKENSQQMQYSQDSAAAVAMHIAGLPVRESLTIAGVDPAYPASAQLLVGDVVQAVRIHGSEEFVPVANFMDVAAFLSGVEPGSMLDMRVNRAGNLIDVAFTVASPTPDATGWVKPGAMIGAEIAVEDVELPAYVEYAVEGIGGPSAGMMFMLGIYDALTEGSLAGNAKIGGTGTMSWNGDVGEIGGIAHKLRGAYEHGVTDFLAPAANCSETVGYIPEGMNVWAVRTAGEAIFAAQAIGRADTSELTPCSAVK